MKLKKPDFKSEAFLGTVILLLGLVVAPAGVWWFSGELVPVLKTVGGVLLAAALLVLGGFISTFRENKEYPGMIENIAGYSLLIPLAAYISWAVSGSWIQAGIVALVVSMAAIFGGIGDAMTKKHYKDTFHALMGGCLIGGITWWLSGGNIGLTLLAGGGLFVLAFLVAALERSQEHGEKHGFGANLLGAALITIFAGCINWYIQQEFSGFIVAALFFGVLSFIIVSLYQFVTTFKKTAAVIVLLLAAPVLFSWFPNLIATAFLAGGVIALFKLRQFLENYEAGKEQKRFQQRLIAMQQEAIQTYGNSQFQHIEKIYKKAVPLNKIEGVILGKVELPGKPARYVDFRDGDHLLTIAPTGAGKGTGSIIPALLTYPGAAFVIDPKGENAAVTARRRRELGQKVFLFDPFGLVTQDTAAWNPLDAVNKNNPNYADDAAAIADAIAVPPGGKADPHWYNAALELLTAIILYLGIIETDPKKKNLAQLRKILTSDIKTIRELFEQIHKTAQGPARDAAGTVITKAEKELSSVISSAQTYTRFLKSELIARTLSHSSFDPADLHSGKATAFVILPNRYLNAYSGWLRLMITHFLNGINAIGKKPEKQILFIVDEAAAVGNLKAITDGYAQMRSYGIQLWPFFQDRAQIKATYAEIGDTMITNAAVKQVFGINDHNTAKWISDELGKRGVVTEQHSYEPINPNSQPRNNIGFAIRERALMTPDELRASTSNILMFKEAEKMRLDKLRYHDDPDFEGLHDENPQITGKPGPGPLFFEPDLSQGNLPPPQDKKEDIPDEDEPEDIEDEEQEDSDIEDGDSSGEDISEESDPLEDLNNLVGLEAVKEQVNKVAALVKLAERRRSKKLPDLDITHHLIFTGNPGTGKTTVARIIGRIYKQYGVLKKGHLVEVGRKDLVGEHWGKGPQKTYEMIDKALDGILFIDEAYALNIDGGSNGDPLGQEVISTLLAGIENHRKRLVVIAAGYSKEMDRFISSNPGLASRFKTTIAFPDYEPAELVKIFEEICRANEVKLADTRARKKLKALVEAIYEQRGENWGNGREMRNLFETCIGNMAQRTAALHSVKNDDMSFIKAADIPDKL